MLKIISSYLFFISLIFNSIFASQIHKFDINIQRREKVKGAFLHAWNGYKKYAWGKDELRPLTNSSHEKFQNWGATLVDALTTLWIMNLTTEFKEAVTQVEKIDFTKAHSNIDFFETTIRYLGGLLGAYDLSGEKVLLDQAIILGNHLLLAFDTPSGLPYNKLSPSYYPFESETVLAGIGTCQLEFTRLSQLTGNPKYSQVSINVFRKLHKISKRYKGLYPVSIDVNNGSFFDSQVTFGANGDSFYEYLIKLYILTNKQEDEFRIMFEESMDAMLALVQKDFNGLKYIGMLDKMDHYIPTMDHLALFVPGMMLYGDHMLNLTKYSATALELVETGNAIYNSTPTYLGSENILFSPTESFKIANPKNSLRPELLESHFYSYQFTNDEKYREYAWNIFQGFEKFSKTPSGYSAYADVMNVKKSINQIDELESFFFAETLKYLYLIFCEPNTIDLNEWVFNTEAHPLRIQK